MKLQKWIILPDVHVPFHNKTLWNKVLQRITEVKPYGLIISGDFLDLHTLGSYSAGSLKALKDITLTYEYAEGLKAIKELHSVTKNVKKKVFIYGNHEDRYFREIAKGDNAKYGDELTSPSDALQLEKYKYEVYENWAQDAFNITQNLMVVHGLYTNIHVAYKHLTELQTSVICGHSHRINSVVQARHGAWNIGTLCDIHSKAFQYMPFPQRNKWCNGFAEVAITDFGEHFVNLIQCWNDKFIIDGRIY